VDNALAAQALAGYLAAAPLVLLGSENLRRHGRISMTKGWRIVGVVTVGLMLGVVASALGAFSDLAYQRAKPWMSIDLSFGLATLMLAAMVLIVTFQYVVAYLHVIRPGRIVPVEAAGVGTTAERGVSISLARRKP